MQLLSYHTYSEALKKEAHRALDGLSRVETHNTRLYSPERQYERRDFRGSVTLKLADENHPVPTIHSTSSCEVLARDISQGGLSFIYPGEIRHRTVLVGLHLPGGRNRWFHGRIVRVRQIGGERFWEYGVCFGSPAEDSEQE